MVSANANQHYRQCVCISAVRCESVACSATHLVHFQRGKGKLARCCKTPSLTRHFFFNIQAVISPCLHVGEAFDRLQDAQCVVFDSAVQSLNSEGRTRNDSFGSHLGIALVLLTMGWLEVTGHGNEACPSAEQLAASRFGNGHVSNAWRWAASPCACSSASGLSLRPHLRFSMLGFHQPKTQTQNPDSRNPKPEHLKPLLQAFSKRPGRGAATRRLCRVTCSWPWASKGGRAAPVELLW